MLSDNREGLLKVAKLMYDFGWAERSLEEIRECLKLDPDDKSCRAHYNKVRKLAKAIKDAETYSEGKKWKDCVKSAKRVIELNDTISDYVLQGNVLVCRCGAKVCFRALIMRCHVLLGYITVLFPSRVVLKKLSNRVNTLFLNLRTQSMLI